MKKILFDLLNAQPAGESKFHGGGEYIKLVFENLINKYKNKCEIIAFYDNEKFIDEWIKQLIDKNSIKCYYIKHIEEIKNIFEKEKIDIYYSGLPYDLKEEYFKENIYKVGTIHGLRGVEKPLDKYTYLYFEENMYLKNIIKDKINHSFKINKNKYCDVINLLDKIVCDSEHSKYSICNYYPSVSMNNVEIFYAPEKKVNDIEVKEIKTEKYILLLGGDRWIKNSYRAIKAIEGLFDDGRLEDYKVTIVGKLPNKIMKKIIHRDRYELLDYVETEKLEELYKNCDIFLYPSLNEGFGMPPLEAMKYGKTCVVSAVTSLPEVCGNAVYYTNPYDIYEIRNRILMASEQKISKEIIKTQLNKITKRQRDDIDRLCEYIIQL